MDNTQSSISDLTHRCIEILQQYCDTNPQNENVEGIRNRLRDLELWSDGVGARAKPKASLDQRLEFRPDEATMVKGILLGLSRFLDEGLRQLQPGQDVKLALRDADSAMRNLTLLAMAIRRSGKKSRLEKVENQYDEKSDDLINLERYLKLVILRENFQQSEPAKQQILHGAFRQMELSSQQKRLVETNKRRRHRFLLAQQHSKGLKQAKTNNSTATREDHKVYHGPAPPLRTTGLTEVSRSSMPKMNPDVATLQASKSTSSGTSFSAPNSDIKIALPQDGFESSKGPNTVITRITASAAYPIVKISHHQQIFQCPCCCQPLGSEYSGDNSLWRKHLGHDVSPYTCIADGCVKPYALYDTVDDLEGHLRRDHTQEWQCCLCDDDPPRFQTELGIHVHFMDVHNCPDAEERSELLDLSLQYGLGVDSCPICGESDTRDSPELVAHVLEHMHEFSLLSLPWSHENRGPNRPEFLASRTKIASDPGIRRNIDEPLFANQQSVATMGQRIESWLGTTKQGEDDDLTQPPLENATIAHPGVTNEQNDDDKKPDFFIGKIYFTENDCTDTSNTSRAEELDDLRNTTNLPSSVAIESTDNKENYNPHRAIDSARTKLSHGDYTIGWICALSSEYAAATAMLDATHDPLAHKADDDNFYTLGQIHQHHVVMMKLPTYAYGMMSQEALSKMRKSYPSIEVYLFVGIGGGVPYKVDVRLGDVVVSERVVRWDLGRFASETMPADVLPSQPSPGLLRAVASLRTQHETQPTQILAIMDKMQNPAYMYTEISHLTDWLFESDYPHVEPIATCEQCDITRTRQRDPRGSNHPHIHYGAIASGSQVMKDAGIRDRIAAGLDVLCFENEAAAMIGNFPYLVIRGICDYADSHKNNQWQPYAAATAAAYAKELLSILPPPIRRREFLQSLRFEEINSRHTFIKLPQFGSCEWFLQHPAYLEWRDLTKSVQHRGRLWIKGRAGSGKSTLMKFLFNRTREVAGHDEVVLSFFFNSRGADLEKSIIGMYRSLLFQLLERLPELHDVLDTSSLQPRSSVGHRVWGIGTLQLLFSQAVSKLGTQRVICFIDALDECDEEQVRDMLETLADIRLSSAGQFHVCFSSRYYPYFQTGGDIEVILEDQSEHEEDMKRYVRRKLRVGTGKGASEVPSDIIRKSSGCFLWAILVIDIINAEFRRGRIFGSKAKMKELPPTLTGLFESMDLINHNRDGSLLCIQLILFAARPLKLEEFYFAAASSLDPTSAICEWDPYSPTLEEMASFVLVISGGLAECTRSKDSIVRFIHESAPDFLIHSSGFRELIPGLGNNIEGPSHNKLRLCCERYMQVDISPYIRHGNDLPKASSTRGRVLRNTIRTKYPFLDYAVHHVLHHANLSGTEDLQPDFFHKFDLVRWISLNNLLEEDDGRRYNPDATWQHILEAQNLTALLSQLEANGTESQPDDSGGHHIPPLIKAALDGNMEAARVLLEQGVDLDVKNGELTPLLAAIQNGHDNMAHMLIANGANTFFDEREEPVLTRASEKRLVNTVHSLLDRGADVNAQGGHFGTALEAASVGGRESVVEVILDRGADVNVQGGYFGNALQAASYHGSKNIVELLLEKGADVNAQGGKYGTALEAARSEGYEAIVNLLLVNGAGTVTNEDEDDLMDLDEEEGDLMDLDEDE